MIEAANICKRFQGKDVLSDVSLNVKTGRVSLIIGGSGMGKTVLMKCISGLIAPDKGQIYYDGRVFIGSERDTLTRAVRREIGMLFQGAALFDSKNVEENVCFPLDLLTNMTDQEKKKRVDFCLNRVDLFHVNHKMPSELSGGMRKRVGIARAIVNRPKYLFCDEPNSGLDPQTSNLIDKLIAEITQEYNITTIVVTHDMNSVLEMGDHVAFLYQGRKLWEGTSAELLETQIPEVSNFVRANKLIQALK